MSRNKIKLATKKISAEGDDQSDSNLTHEPIKKTADDQQKLKRARDTIPVALTTDEVVSTPTKKVKVSSPSTGKQIFNFYRQHADLEQRTTDEVHKFLQANNISVSGHDLDYKPIQNFKEFSFGSKEGDTAISSSLSKLISKYCSSFSQPTPIQSACWPVMLTGRDVVGIAETGSGKTLAFLLPAIVHTVYKMQKSQKGSSTVLVLSPTRELAMQTAQVCEAVLQSQGKFNVNKKDPNMIHITSTCIYGGVPKQPQFEALQRGADILIATPGRLVDLVINDNCGSLGQITFLVLDEADRMLDMGFEKDIRAIMGQLCPKNLRQTAMFSATWPKSVQSIAAEYIDNPVKVVIRSKNTGNNNNSNSETEDVDEDVNDGSSLKANKNVKQIVEVIDDMKRDQRLHQLLQQYHDSGNRRNKILIFVLYKKEASRVENMLMKRKWNATSIHADKSQAQRTKAYEDFKSGRIPLLVATDVAARGLDVPDIEYVINYSFPLTIEDYVHRIGRTARAGKKGVAHTLFVANRDKMLAGPLVNLLRESGQDVPPDMMQFNLVTKKKEHKLYGNHFKQVDNVPMPEKKHIRFDDE